MEGAASVVIRRPGSVDRLAQDSPIAAGVPAGLRFETAIPGGFTICSFTLAYDPAVGRQRPDVLDSATVYAPTGEVMFDGYVAERPAGENELTVSLVGWQGVLKWPTGFREVYVDSDLNHWVSASVTRRLQLDGIGLHQVTDPVVDHDASGSTLRQTVQGPWVTLPFAEAWYDAMVPISSVYYAWRFNMGADSLWLWWLTVASAEDSTGAEQSSQLQAASATGSGTFTPTNQDRTYLSARFYYNAGNTGSAGYDYNLYWTVLGIFGTHGLTKVGAGSLTAPPGLYAHDIAADIVERAAPLLVASLGDAVEYDYGAVTTQCAFREMVTAEEALLDLNKGFGKVWGVYEGRKFFWRSRRNPQRRWRCRLADGVKLTTVGRQVEDTVNGVWVTYTDPGGRVKSAGPPGSGADTENAALEDTSSTNPVNAHGLGRKWLPLSDIGTATAENAVAYGAASLADATTKTLRGEVTIPFGSAMTVEGVRKSVHQLRAGDELTVSDAADEPSGMVVGTSCDYDSGTLTASIDTTPHRAEVLLELLQAKVAPLG